MNCYSIRRVALVLPNPTNRWFTTGLKSLKISNYYDVLGVNQNCSSKEIKAAYVKLCKEYHPDKKPQDPDQHRKFVSLNEAYGVLSKPGNRRQYDASLASPFARPYPSYGTMHSQQTRHAWRDETIWSMRDRSHDKYYQGKPHYGPFRKEYTSKTSTVVFCLILLTMGSILHVMFYTLLARSSEKRIKEKELLDFLIYAEVRKNAMSNSKEQQIEFIFGERTELNDSAKTD